MRARTACKKTSKNQRLNTVLSVHADFWEKYGSGHWLPSPMKHIGWAALPIIATGTLWDPVALQHNVSVTRSILFIALDPRSRRRSSAGTYERDGRPRYSSPVPSTLYTKSGSTPWSCRRISAILASASATLADAPHPCNATFTHPCRRAQFCR